MIVTSCWHSCATAMARSCQQRGTSVPTGGNYFGIGSPVTNATCLPVCGLLIRFFVPFFLFFFTLAVGKRTDVINLLETFTEIAGGGEPNPVRDLRDIQLRVIP